jgi:hypothetical protein
MGTSDGVLFIQVVRGVEDEKHRKKYNVKVIIMNSEKLKRT